MPLPLTHEDPCTFDSFRLVARLGSGGMGTVYLARSPGGRTVAVKTMHARIASDPAFRTRFRLEADAARVIGGQYGARVVAADPLAETPWLATEYVLGPPLDDAVDLAGPLPEPSVRALGAALCAALGQLHGSDVVHRDLKPSNVMITAYGPKVIDFGIARAIGDDRLTGTGAAVGTPAFMSPEQATGQEHTSAGDVFALAGVLVFAATGHGPFGYGQAADLLYRVRYAEPDLGGVPAALVPILAPCLDKDPTRRPTTSALAARLHDGDGEFADHLPDALLADIGRRATEIWQIMPQRLPAPADRPEPRPTAAAGRTSRRRLLAVGGGLVVATAAAGAGVWAWRERSEPETEVKKASGPERNIASQWKHGISPHDMAPLTPIPTGDLFVVANGNVTAGDIRTGDEKWQAYRRSADTYQVAVDGERLYLIDADTNTMEEGDEAGPLVIAALDLAGGEEERTVARFSDLGGGLRGNQLLCTAGGVLYLAVGRGKYDVLAFRADQSWFLQAVDANTGERLWSTSLPPRPDKSERLHFLAARVVGDRLVLLQETDEGAVRIVVRDTATGAVRWDEPLTVDYPELVRVPMATDDEYLYLGCGPLQARSLADGSQAWTTETDAAETVYGPPTLNDGVLYVVEQGRGLAALAASDGKVLWTEEDGEQDKADLTYCPVVGPKYAYYKSGLELRAISLSTHEPAFSYQTSGRRFVPHARGKMIIAVDDDYIAGYPLR